MVINLNECARNKAFLHFLHTSKVFEVGEWVGTYGGSQDKRIAPVRNTISVLNLNYHFKDQEN